MAWSNIKQEMPLLALNEGVWADTYRWVDPEGTLLNEHRCTMLVTFPEQPPYAYHQTNMYTWADGRAATKDFQIRYVEGSKRFAIWDRDVAGWVTEPADDDQNLTTYMKWVRVGGTPEDAGVYYEMINNSACGRYRARVWQQLQDGQVVRRCFINGTKVATDWRAYVDGNPEWDYCMPAAARCRQVS
ncbi:MAG: DUF3598 domain-containing protein [Gammaproteobacteria bacterium]|nr:DUF3598 domain-containing protein [Gammaproteobacteria bacterium]